MNLLAIHIHSKNCTENLNLEFDFMDERPANKTLSVTWLINECWVRSGISLLNVTQLIALVQNTATARALFHEYQVRLTEFVQQHLPQSRPLRLIIEGNIVQVWRILLPFITKRLPHITLAKGGPGKRSSLVGACLLYFDTQVENYGSRELAY